MAKSVARIGLRRLRSGPLHPAWPLQVEVVLEVMRATIAEGVKLDPAVMRAQQEQLAAQLPSPVVKKVRRTPASYGGVAGEWLVPLAADGDRQDGAAASRLPTLFYLHGGGYVFGSANTHADLMAAIACAGPLRVFAPSYRLAPEHRFPAALDDALAAYEAFTREVGPAARIVIGGDSAGGGLSLALLARLREAGAPQPAGAVLLSPWVDLSCSPTSYERNARYDFAGRETLLTWARYYAGTTPLSHPELSPLQADLRGLPPLYVVSGGIELLADEIASLVEKARAAGVAVEQLLQPEMVHNFPMLHSIYEPAKQAIAKIADFVKARANS